MVDVKKHVGLSNNEKLEEGQVHQVEEHCLTIHPWSGIKTNCVWVIIDKINCHVLKEADEKQGVEMPNMYLEQVGEPSHHAVDHRLVCRRSRGNVGSEEVELGEGEQECQVLDQSVESGPLSQETLISCVRVNENFKHCISLSLLSECKRKKKV